MNRNCLRWMLPLVVIALGAQAQPSTEPVWLLSPERPGPDLPPRGHSLFDRIFGTTGKHVLPKTFPELQEAIAQLSTAAPAKVLVPKGRSLQRLAARPLDPSKEQRSEWDSINLPFYKSPRAIFAAVAESKEVEGALEHDLRNRLFVAFARKSNQLEVISFNDSMGRFEFQLVQNYDVEGKTPTVRYAQRAVCLKCHQNHAGIFPEFPWRETNFETEIIREIKKALPNTKSFEGVAIENREPNDVGDIDEATDKSNALAIATKLWVEACGGKVKDGPECRGLLLLHSLNEAMKPKFFDYVYREKTKRLKALWHRNLKALYPQGVKLPTANLPSAFVAPDKLFPMTSAELQRSPLATLKGDDYTSDAIDVVGYVAEALGGAFTSYDVAKLRRASGDKFERIVAAVDKLVQGARRGESHGLGTRGFHRPSLVQGLLSNLGETELPPWLGFVESGLPEKLPEGDGGAGVHYKVKHLEHFRTYCAGCHQSGPFPPAFMKGNDAEASAKLALCAERVLRALDWSPKNELAMPPPETAERMDLRGNDLAAGAMREEAANLLRQNLPVDVSLVNDPDLIVFCRTGGSRD